MASPRVAHAPEGGVDGRDLVTSLFVRSHSYLWRLPTEQQKIKYKESLRMTKWGSPFNGTTEDKESSRMTIVFGLDKNYSEPVHNNI